MAITFTVGRQDLRRTGWLEAAAQALAPGQVRLRIDRFALTSNNVTYGAFGDAMHYWDSSRAAIPRPAASRCGALRP